MCILSIERNDFLVQAQVIELQPSAQDLKVAEQINRTSNSHSHAGGKDKPAVAEAQ